MRISLKRLFQRSTSSEATGTHQSASSIEAYAHSDIQFLLRLLADAFRTIRSLKEPAPKKADFAAECAMKCDDPVFRRYLFERHQVDTQDRERVAIRVRSMLAISSRSELNSDPEAAARWKSLRAEFEAWRIAT